MSVEAGDEAYQVLERLEEAGGERDLAESLFERFFERYQHTKEETSSVGMEPEIYESEGETLVRFPQDEANLFYQIFLDDLERGGVTELVGKLRSELEREESQRREIYEGMLEKAFDYQEQERDKISVDPVGSAEDVTVGPDEVFDDRGVVEGIILYDVRYVLQDYE